MRFGSSAVLAASIALLAVFPASASAGNVWDLDPTFSGDGITRNDFGGDLSFDSFDSAVQGDGKSIQAGLLHDTGTGAFKPVVVRLSYGGTLDPTFSGDGIFTLDAQASSTPSLFNKVAVDSQGRIVASGLTAPALHDAANSHGFMVRIAANGVLDGSFSALEADDMVVDDFVIEGDDSIVLASTEYDTGPEEDFVWLRKLTTTGTPAAGFTPQARQVNTNSTQATAMGKTSDGYVVSVLENKVASYVLKYESDGDTDTTYGSSGRTSFSFVGSLPYPNGDVVTELAVAADDSVWLTGYHGHNNNGFVTHMPANGVNTNVFLDWTETASYVMGSTNVEFYDIVIHAGKPIVAGSAVWGGNKVPVIVRVSTDTWTDPVRDNTFGPNGDGIQAIEAYMQVGSFRGLSIYPDGRLFAGGSTWNADLISARFGTAPASAPSGGSLTLSGKGWIGHTVNALATFAGDNATIAYTWQRCDDQGAGCVTVSSIASSSMLLSDAMLGGRIKVIATATNVAGSASVSVLTNVIARQPSSRCAGLPAGGDADGDSLINLVECDVVRERGGTQVMDLPSLGADPMHKDIFLEVDAMPYHTLRQDAANRVMKAFADSPVINPDGSTGIRLHIDNGSNSPIYYGSTTTWGALSRASTRIPEKGFTGSFDKEGNYKWDEVDTIKSTNFEQIRRFAFFYMLSSHRYGEASNRSSGVARTNNFDEASLGQDFIMSLGGFGDGEYQGTSDEQAGTMMHELGHLLGLGHGGRPGGVVDDENDKPNYPSIMSYNWQLTGIKRVDGGTTLDYSRFGSVELPTLNENLLNESTGVVATRGAEKFMIMHRCTSVVVNKKSNSVYLTTRPSISRPNAPVDWDCSGGAKPINKTTAVKYDLNRMNGTGGVAYAKSLTKLVPSDDWGNLVYSGGAIGAAGAGAGSVGDGLTDMQIEQVGAVPAVAKSQNIDKQATLTEMLPYAQVVSGDSVAPRIRITRAARRTRRKAVKVTVKIRDNRKGMSYAIKVDARKPVTYSVSRQAATSVILLKKGRHVITVTARDTVGNTTRQRRRIRVR